MDLSDFVKTVLVSINEGVDAARSQTSRDIHFTQDSNSRTVEFDIAVSAEDKKAAEGKAGIKVLQFAEAGGNISSEKTNSTVSRIQFGVDIEQRTKEEQAKQDAEWEAYSAEQHAGIAGPGIY
jgi:hypothetical protein